MWQSPRRALTPRIEAAADRMGRVDRMKASPRRRVKMARSIALGAQAHSGIGVNGVRSVHLTNQRRDWERSVSTGLGCGVSSP